MAVLEIENPAAGVRLLRMNRPEKHNALNSDLTEALLRALQEAGTDDDCRAIVLTGAGKSFCAGADTSEFAGLSDADGTLALARADLTTRLHAVFNETDRPIIAAVRGNALGGGAGLMLACDMVVAAEDMRFGYPELRHGIVPAVVMANLVRQLGRKTAFALVATGRLLDGREAAELGLANESVGADAVTDRALEIATGLAAWSPVALRTTKRLFYRVADLPLAAALQVGRDTNIVMRGFQRGKGGAA